jgi:hypothetical protein
MRERNMLYYIVGKPKGRLRRRRKDNNNKNNNNKHFITHTILYYNKTKTSDRSKKE